MPRKSKPKTPSSKLSFVNVRSDGKEISKSYNAMWNCVSKAPLFLRRPKMVGVGKTKSRATYKNKRGEDTIIPQKINRCIRRFPLRVLLSAATANAAAILGKEAEAMRVDSKGEANVSGALPNVTKGAELALEHAFVAYAQSAFSNAISIRDSMKMHKKVTTGAMSAATRILNSQLSSGTGISPGNFLVDKKRKIAKKKPKKEAPKKEVSVSDE